MDAPPFPADALAAARDAAKAHLRISGDQENALIESYAATALALAEAFCQRAMIMRAWETILPARRSWQSLPVAGVLAIRQVEGRSADGDSFALPVESYAIDIGTGGVGWVRVIAPGAAARVAIRYDAGTAEDWSALPAPIAQGMVLLIAHLFDGKGASGPPAAVSALWRPWRRLRLSRDERAA